MKVASLVVQDCGLKGFRTFPQISASNFQPTSPSMSLLCLCSSNIIKVDYIHEICTTRNVNDCDDDDDDDDDGGNKLASNELEAAKVVREIE